MIIYMFSVLIILVRGAEWNQKESFYLSFKEMKDSYLGKRNVKCCHTAIRCWNGILVKTSTLANTRVEMLSVKTQKEKKTLTSICYFILILSMYEYTVADENYFISIFPPLDTAPSSINSERNGNKSISFFVSAKAEIQITWTNL